MMKLQTISLLMTCPSDMHMDIEKANEILNCISHNPKYQIISDYTKADIIIIMTCAFGTGKKHSMYVIADVQRNCKTGAKIVATGCLVKLNPEELKAIPNLELKTIQEVKEAFGKVNSNTKLVPQNKVVISSGCLKRCSYCVYPLIENTYKSKPIEDILEEVEKLYQNEIVIYISGGLETSDYGIDLYGKRKFPELLDNICNNFPECNYIVGWFHPAGLTDELLSVIEKHKNIVEIMIHIQHVNNKILANMNRPSFDFTNERILKLKKLRPDIIISSEVIVGFPGETEKEFEELIEYLDLGLFQDIGVASYEPVLGTKAATLPDLPPFDIRKKRMEYIRKRYNCTAYPAPEVQFEPIIKNYIEALNWLDRLPKMIKNPEARQKYKYIAGLDTNLKEPEIFQKLTAEIFEEIINARDEFEISQIKEDMNKTYTLEFREYMYQLIKSANLKPKMLQKAKIILMNE